MRFCGAGVCRDITDPVRLHMLQSARWQGAPRGPATLRAYYSISLLDRAGRPIESSYDMPRYYVPRAEALVRDSVTIHWLALGSWSVDYHSATRRLRPFPRPRVASVAIGDREAADPHSYLRLYDLRAASATDPAGLHPSITGNYDESALTEYYARMRRHWIPIVLRTARPSPWGDDRSFVWIARSGSLLRRDFEVVRIDPRLAACVRRAVSLRSCGRG